MTEQANVNTTPGIEEEELDENDLDIDEEELDEDEDLDDEEDLEEDE